jgi:hypothetical protein
MQVVDQMQFACGSTHLALRQAQGERWFLEVPTSKPKHLRSSPAQNARKAAPVLQFQFLA